MLGSVFTKSVRDRWVGEVVAGVSMGLLLWFTMAIYADFDLSFYYEMPAAIREMAGISRDVGGLGGLAFGSIYNLMGALTVAGIAISTGASSIAGEERDGTLGLLLANPRSRGSVLAAKAGALVVLAAAGTGLLWLAGLAVPPLVGVEVTGVHLAALMVHLGANAVFWGMLALAIGAWTGNRTAASGFATGAMVLGYLVATLVPLFPDVADLAQASPWYWFSGSQPSANGIHPGHLALLLGGAVVLYGIARVGVGRRDLREHDGRTTLLDRLRTHPLTRRWADRIAGSARVSSIMARASSDHQGLLVVVAYVLAVMGLAYGPMFNLLPPEFAAAMSSFPDTLLAMIGQADMATPAGWLQGELFSLVVPIGMITVLVTVGSRALAGEERERTMDLLLGNPVSRRRVLLSKAGVMLAYAVVLGVATFAGVAAGVVVGGLGVPLGNLAGAVLLATLLALAIGGVAFVVGAATGRVRPAVGAATGVALLAYFTSSFLPLSPDLASWADLSPWHWYLGGDPLNAGLDWSRAGLLAALAVALVALSIPLFQRRDLRG